MYGAVVGWAAPIAPRAGSRTHPDAFPVRHTRDDALQRGDTPYTAMLENASQQHTGGPACSLYIFFKKYAEYT